MVKSGKIADEEAYKKQVFAREEAVSYTHLRSVDMEYRGMKEDERFVSVKPGQRQMMQTFKRFQNGIQMQQP